MKQLRRRRRHLRPSPTRAQINQQISRVCNHLRLFQAEWLLEAQQEQPRLPRLRFLQDAILVMRDEVNTLERL